MKIKEILTAALLSAAVLMMPGLEVSAQKYEGGLIDKTVALVGNSVILLSDVESDAIYMQSMGYVSDRNVRCEALENIMVTKLFYTQAVLDSLAVNPDMVDAMLSQQVDGILSRFGGEKAVEAYFKKPMHELREGWRNRIMEESLANEMRRTIAGKVPEVTPKEVERFYKRTSKDSLPVIPDQYKISEITIYPNVERAELAARERLLEFRQRVMDGEKFSLLATLYSEDPGSAMRGGELGMSSKSLFWPEFSDAAMSLKPGQVSPIVKTPNGYHLIQLIARDGDMFNARHILLKPRYTAEDRDSAFIRLDSIRNAVLADSITFEQAAKKFSQDPLTRTNGGLVPDVETGAPFIDIDKLKPEEYNVLKNMKPGEISRPIESTDNESRAGMAAGNTAYKIIRLDEIREAHTPTFNQDFDILLNMATNQKAEEAVEAFVNDKIGTIYIVIDPLFQKCVFQRDGWVK